MADSDIAEIRSAIQQNDSNLIIERIQERLDAYCVAGVRINDESRVTVEAGPADKVLVQQGCVLGKGPQRGRYHASA